MSWRTRKRGTKKQVGKKFPVVEKKRLPQKITGSSQVEKYRTEVFKQIKEWSEFKWLDEKTIDPQVVHEVNVYRKLARLAKTKPQLDLVMAEAGGEVRGGPHVIIDEKAKEERDLIGIIAADLPRYSVQKEIERNRLAEAAKNSGQNKKFFDSWLDYLQWQRGGKMK